jgi:hypothetical protein
MAATGLSVECAASEEDWAAADGKVARYREVLRSIKAEARRKGLPEDTAFLCMGCIPLSFLQQPVEVD